MKNSSGGPGRPGCGAALRPNLRVRGRCCAPTYVRHTPTLGGVLTTPIPTPKVPPAPYETRWPISAGIAVFHHHEAQQPDLGASERDARDSNTDHTTQKRSTIEQLRTVVPGDGYGSLVLM